MCSDKNSLELGMVQHLAQTKKNSKPFIILVSTQRLKRELG